MDHIFLVHSNSCMLGQKWVWLRSDCISVTSMVQNVLTVVWPEIPTVPGMVSPAPDTTLLESTPAGGNSIYTHSSVQESFSFYCKCLQELSSVCTFNSRHPLGFHFRILHNAVKLVSQVIITDTERHASQMLCNANQYALDHPLPLSIFPALFSPRSRSLCLSFHPSLALSSHVQNYSLFASLSLFSRRFRRQDVRHGNAVQLCNGLQIDG